MRPRNSGGGIASTLSCRRLIEKRKDTTRMPNHLHAWVHLLSLASCFDGSFAWSSAAGGVSKWNKFLTPPKIPRPDSATDGVMPKRQKKPVIASNTHKFMMPLHRRSSLSLSLYRDFGDAGEGQSSDDEVDDKAPKTPGSSPASPDASNDLGDWKEFQQRLIESEQQSNKCHENDINGSSSISSSSLQRISNVHDIMPGTILLATLPSRDEQGYGLGRQYLHKSIIYIVDVDFDHGITGLILNRTPMFELGLLSIEGKKLEESSNGWVVGLGGDSFSFDEEMEDVDTSASSVNCLFFRDVDPMCEACKEISSGVYFTSQGTARRYVHESLAKPDDFWLFYGHMHWSFEEMQQEIVESIWQAVDINDGGDPLDVLKEIRSKASLEYGMQIWETLCDALNEETNSENLFDDRMLEEYCLASLPMTRENHEDTDDDEYVPRRQGGTYSVSVGDLLRASSASHSPFLLSDQEYHHSVILVLQEEKQFSVGIILNLPSSEKIDLTLGREQVGSLNILYGGPMKCAGSPEQVFFFHKSKAMKDLALGEHLDVDSSSYNIWKCTKAEATEALLRGVVNSDEIIAVDGLCVWPKDEFGGGGLRAELVKGHFERVPLPNYDKVWRILQQQNVPLSSENLDNAARIAEAAWAAAGDGKGIIAKEMNDKRRKLAKEAHKQWILNYLLR